MYMWRGARHLWLRGERYEALHGLKFELAPRRPLACARKRAHDGTDWPE